MRSSGTNGAPWPDGLAEVLRHLSSLEIDLDRYELQVRSILPSKGLPLGDYTANLNRTIELDKHPALRRAVAALVAEVRGIMARRDPRFQPDRCDRCVRSDCCEFERIFLEEQEAAAILAHLGRPASDFSLFFKRERDLAGHYKLMLRHRAGHCTFLRKRGPRMRCSIYEARPRICREFDASTCECCTETLP